MRFSSHKDGRAVRRVAGFMMAACAAAVLSACTFDTPTDISKSSPEVYRDTFHMEKDTAALNANALGAVAQEYWARGDGTALVTVMYDPQSRINTARHAADAAHEIAETLRRKGMKNVEVEALPVQDSGEVSKTMISFDTVNARPPSDCGEPLGKTYADLENLEGYKIGCSVDTYLARQIARPKDLLGNDAEADGTGRRVVNSLEGYMDGQPNEELSGDYASEN